MTRLQTFGRLRPGPALLVTVMLLLAGCGIIPQRKPTMPTGGGAPDGSGSDGGEPDDDGERNKDGGDDGWVDTRRGKGNGSDRIHTATVVDENKQLGELTTALKSRNGQLRGCLPAEFVAEGVQLSVRARLAADGSVRGATLSAGSNLSPDASACIIDIIQATPLSPSKEGSSRIVTIPLVF